jgi:hypothetical protein
MEAGENVGVLARELGVYARAFMASPVSSGRGQRSTQPARSSNQSRGLSREETPAVEKQLEKGPRQTSLEEQARAQRRIAALERKIGEQQVERDFFQRALRQIGEQRLRSGVAGGTAFPKSSKR